jgi:hypothetical protein
MTRYSKIAGLAILAVLISAPLASAQRHGGFRGGHGEFRGGFRGGFGYGGGYYGGWYGPGWGWYGPGWGWGWYGPGWYGPYGYAYGYDQHSDSGKVKIDTKAKDTEVFVDGGYAGTVKQLKTFRLKAGEHDIELRHPTGESFYQQHINVIEGKTIHIKP